MTPRVGRVQRDTQFAQIQKDVACVPISAFFWSLFRGRNMVRMLVVFSLCGTISVTVFRPTFHDLFCVLRSGFGFALSVLCFCECAFRWNASCASRGPTCTLPRRSAHRRANLRSRCAPVRGIVFRLPRVGAVWWPVVGCRRRFLSKIAPLVGASPLVVCCT